MLERHPDLRIGIVELSAVWVPMYLMMLDGGVRLHDPPQRPRAGRARRCAPSEYFRRQVRVSSFSYELPEHLHAPARRRGPAHGAAATTRTRRAPPTPIADYAATGKYGTDPDRAPGLFHDNAAFLLHAYVARFPFLR